jgi:hypothetical protein
MFSLAVQTPSSQESIMLAAMTTSISWKVDPISYFAAYISKTFPDHL